MPQIALYRFPDNAPSVRILVAGEVMLDAYISGSADRISPEAPVPVLGVSQRRYLPGGAANVAANILAPGSRVALAGVTGVDDSAVRLRRKLERTGVNRDALVEDAMRQPTTKTRITAAGRQIARFDGATVVTPNLKETAAAAGERIETSGDLDRAAGVPAIALGPGFTLFDAASTANIAAGAAVGHPGTWAVRREEFPETAAREAEPA